MKISVNKSVISVLSLILTLSFLGCKFKDEIQATHYSDKKVYMLNSCLDEAYLYDLEEVTDQQMLNSIYSNYVSMLENPATYYLDEDMLKQSKIIEEGKYIGTGLNLAMERDGRSLIVTRVIENSFADKVGIKTGQRIVSIDDIEINGATQLEIVEKISYLGDEKIKYQFEEDSTGEIKEVLLGVTTLEVPDSTFKIYDDVGYIDIEYISDNTSSNIANILSEMEAQSAKGIILDLRGVYTNNIEEVSKVADLFLEDGTAFKAKGKEDIDSFNMTVGSYKGELVIITDGSTTGGTEALVSALKGISKQVGSDTNGLSYISEIIELGDGTGVKVATKIIYDKYGNELPEAGIEPDEQVFISDEEIVEYMETGTISTDNDSFIKVALNQFN